MNDIKKQFSTLLEEVIEELNQKPDNNDISDLRQNLSSILDTSNRNGSDFMEKLESFHRDLES